MNVQFLALSVAYFIFLVFLSAPVLAAAAPGPVGIDGGVQIEKKEVIVHGQSMAPIFEDGDRARFQRLDCANKPDSCLNLKRGDFVVFNKRRRGGMPLVKEIAGVGGDVLSLNEDLVLTINGEEAQTPSGDPYIPTEQGMKMFFLLSGTIPEGTYIVLGLPGSLDSGRFGPVKRENIIGLLEKQKVRGK
jgi:signal peptidase I